MTTPTGQISMSQIRLEIYGSATGQISLLDSNVRTLAGQATGDVAMSECKGKTWGGGGATFTVTMDVVRFVDDLITLQLT